MSSTTGRSPAPLEVLFIALAALGLVGTWAQGFHYLALGFLAGNVQFWKETVATPASTFLTVDVLVLAAAFYGWMFAEGRRLGIGTAWLWAYFFAGLFVAVGFAVPSFLAHRQRRIRLHRPADAAAPAGADWIAVGMAVTFAVVATVYSLGHVP